MRFSSAVSGAARGEGCRLFPAQYLAFGTRVRAVVALGKGAEFELMKRRPTAAEHSSFLDVVPRETEPETSVCANKSNIRSPLFLSGSWVHTER